MILVTSRYHAGPLIEQAIEEQALIPIGITVGAARYLRYELAANLGPLAPFGGLMKLEGDEFDLRFVQRLETFGAPAIKTMISGVVDAYHARGAILLCFEKVDEGEACHRRTFATWWEEKTGQEVPELSTTWLRTAKAVTQ
jgi:hypothetical protein